MFREPSLFDTVFRRRSLFLSGKNLRIIFILLLQFSHFSNSKTVQKGGILFEDIGGAQVNGDFISYKREADTKKLEEGIQAGSDLLVIYNNICNRVINSVRKAKEEQPKTPDMNKMEFIISPVKYPIGEAGRVCKNMAARLPEVKTWDDQARLLTIMEANDIWYAKAGIYYKTELAKYFYITSELPADKQTIFTTISYGGDYPGGKWEANWHNDETVKKMAAKYFLAYKRWKGISVRMVDSKERENIEYIVCQKFPPENIHVNDIKNNVLYQVTAHNCARDMDSVMQHMTYTINEARTITNLNLNITESAPDYKTFFPDMGELEETFNLVTPQRRTRDTPGQLQMNLTMIGEPHMGPKNNKASYNEPQEPEAKLDREPRSITAALLMAGVPINSLANQKIQRLYQQEVQHHICQLAGNNTEPHDVYNTYSFDAVMNNNYQTAQHRGKRAIPLVPIVLTTVATAAGINAISSAYNGGAPLSWFGQTIGPLLGLSTDSNPDLKNVLIAMAKEIRKLNINDEKVFDAITKVATQAVKFEQKYILNMDAVVMLVMIQDLCNTIRYISQIIQTTVAKYAQILLASSAGKTSPYAISQETLAGLSRALYLHQGLNLQQDINLIKSKAYIDNNKLIIVFDVPVLAETHQYNFYQPTPMPIYNKDEVHMPVLDATHIAISKNGAKYLSMTHEEFRQCKTDPNECQVRRPARPINDKSSCTIRSYTTNVLQCPVQVVADPTSVPPFLHVEGNVVIFAINGSLTMYVKCQEHRFSATYRDETVVITDRGQVTLRSACSVTLPDGSTFDTSSLAPTKFLKDLPIFDQLSHLPKPTGYKITRNNETIMQFNTTILIEKAPEEKKVLSLEELIENAFTSKNTFAFGAQITIFIIIILSIAITCCCCRHRIMSCLRATKIRKPNPNKPSRLVERCQQEMHDKFEKLGKDVNNFKTDVKKMFVKAAPHPDIEAQMRGIGDIGHSQHNIKFSDLHDYEELNPPSLNRSKFQKFHLSESRSQFPSIVRQQLAEADKAYRTESKIVF